MDDLYENLDNYNEESTIAELQTENKELKYKLEEYAVTLSKLQTEFDKLSSEYKQLELNYSSLLKTAKAEIERKTHIITNLNLEKDRMVLKSFQNKNAGGFYKSRGDNLMVQQNYKNDKNEKNKQDEKLKNFEGRKLSPYSSTERKEIDDTPSSDTTINPHVDLRTKLLNLAHRGQQHDPRTERPSDLKENIMQPTTEIDAIKARASIRNRRKSMPAISVETEQVSEDDDIGIAASTTNLQQTSMEHNFSEKQKHVDHNFQERPRSRTSETSSFEEKKSGYHEPTPDRQKQRSSRYDRDKDDKYRVRHKSSHRYRRESPDRYRSGSREYHDPYHRSEHDRPRARGLESPPRDKFHQRQSRELYRNYERSLRNDPYKHERLLPRSQERYVMKRRVEHIYDDFENKRMKMEPHSRHSEENRRMDNKGLKMESHSRHHEGDRRINDERKSMHKNYTADPLEIQFSTCESPDYVYPDISNQQVKEIKLTATTKLDDPRISSKKYVFRKDDCQSVLTTAIGRNIDIVPFRNIAWGIPPVSMPEALVKRPPDPKQSARNVDVEIENPANISFESGEIEDINTQNYPEIVNKVKVANSERKGPPLPVTKFDDFKDLEKSLKYINSYKIPKHRKSVDEKQNSKYSKEVISSEKPIHDNTDSFKSNKNSDIAIKDIEVNKQQAKPATGKKELDTYKQDSYVKQSNNQLLCLGTSNMLHEQKYPTAKEVVEGDLEMSDDNCDDNEKSEHVTEVPVFSTGLENKEKNKPKNCDTNTEKQSTDTLKKVSTEPSQDKTSTGDSKKSKTKKKSKHKDIKDSCKSGDSAKVFEKPAKKKEKRNETTSLQIKTKFSELFDDSSSLIFPEDLGLTAVAAPTTRLPDKCVPFFEDALDAADLNTIKSDSIKDSIPPETSNVEMKPNTDVKVSKLDTANQHTIEEDIHIQEDILEKSDDKSNDVPTEMTDDVIKSIYQNLEPGVSEEQDNVVKTIIISTGIQPPVVFEDDEQEPPSKPEPLVKTIKDVGLNALATSTPHKIWQPDVAVATIESKPSDSGCNSNNNSQIVSFGNSELMDKSDSNTVDSQTNDANVPDVRIFIKRRRKTIKK